jgi:hypothetical protein
VTTIVGPTKKQQSKMGMKDYKLTEKLATLIEKKSAVYKLTWMQPDAKQLKL